MLVSRVGSDHTHQSSGSSIASPAFNSRGHSWASRGQHSGSRGQHSGSTSGSSIMSPAITGLRESWGRVRHKAPTILASMAACSSYGRPSGESSDSGESNDSVARLKRLTAKLDPDLLRGVPAKHVLRCCGQTLKTFNISAGSTQEYSLSEHVSKLDDFISHNWAASRWMKYLSLSLLYNSFAASCCSCVVGAALMFLQLDSVAVVPKLSVRPEIRFAGYRPGMLSMFACPVVFWIILFQWQEIKAMICVGKQKVLFLDKICVDQADERKKTKAVLGLAGFLVATDRLVVLWTPAYFTRLWCVYEIASWLYLEKPMESVYFIPAGRTWYVFSTHIGLTIFWIMLGLSRILIGDANAMICFLLLLPWVHLVRRSVNTLQLLPEILSRFEIRDVKCHCCIHGHIDPHTGQALRCDRVLVFNTIRAWFGVDGKGREAALTHFERAVRVSFGKVILNRAGPTQLPYSWAMIVSLPVSWYLFDILASSETMPSVLFAVRLCVGEYVVICAAVLPSLFKIFLHIFVQANRLFGWKQSLAANVMISVLVSIVCFAVACLLWGPLPLLNTTFDNPLPLIMWDVICVVLAVSLYRTDKSTRQLAVPQVPSSDSGLHDEGVNSLGSKEFKDTHLEAALVAEMPEEEEEEAAAAASNQTWQYEHEEIEGITVAWESQKHDEVEGVTVVSSGSLASCLKQPRSEPQEALVSVYPAQMRI